MGEQGHLFQRNKDQKIKDTNCNYLKCFILKETSEIKTFSILLGMYVMCDIPGILEIDRRIEEELIEANEGDYLLNVKKSNLNFGGLPADIDVSFFEQASG